MKKSKNKNLCFLLTLIAQGVLTILAAPMLLAEALGIWRYLMGFVIFVFMLTVFFKSADKIGQHLALISVILGTGTAFFILLL